MASWIISLFLKKSIEIRKIFKLYAVMFVLSSIFMGRKAFSENHLFSLLLRHSGLFLLLVNLTEPCSLLRYKTRITASLGSRLLFSLIFQYDAAEILIYGPVVVTIDSYLKIVSENIKKRRKELGLKQKDMVAYGIGLRHYQDIEHGKTNLTLRTLQKIAIAFNTSVEVLTSDRTKISICDETDNLFDRLISNLPIACIICELPDINNKYSLRLYAFNEAAEALLLPNLNAHIRKRILDIFPNIEITGLLDAFVAATKKNTIVKLSDQCYFDENITMSYFDFKIIPFCKSRLIILLNRTTERKIYEQFINLRSMNLNPL